MQHDLRTGAIQGLIVLVPSYTMAYLTEMMVYTIPTLAAATFIAAAIKPSAITTRLEDMKGKE
tara:strand:- start:1801 stop:1989 length:189 start_codon:yes stop_codon:yes gene_type:complete